MLVAMCPSVGGRCDGMVGDAISANERVLIEGSSHPTHKQ